MIRKSTLNNKIIEKTIEKYPILVLTPKIIESKMEILNTKFFSNISTRIKGFEKLEIVHLLNFPSFLIFFSNLNSLKKYIFINKNILLFQIFNFFIKSNNLNCLKRFDHKLLALNLIKSLQRSLSVLRLLNLKK